MKGKPFFFNLINEIKNPKKWIDKRWERISKKTSQIYKTAEEEIDLIILTEESKAINIQAKKDVILLKDKIRSTKKRKLKIDVFSKIPEAYQSTLRPFIQNPLYLIFIIFFLPKQSSLRKYEETNQIYPLGIKGEGLLQYLKELALDEKNKETLPAIKENLMLLDLVRRFLICPII